MQPEYLQRIGISMQSKQPTLQLQRAAPKSTRGAAKAAASSVTPNSISSKPLTNGATPLDQACAPASSAGSSLFPGATPPCCLLGQGFAQQAIVKPGRAPWLLPNAGHDVGLKAMNSLTGEKEPFVPLDGKKIRWYTCGPTVYDVAHMGHARAYLTFDILRRIMKDYFEYDVMYQINITDIDDKIILRSRQNELMKQFKAEVADQDMKVLEATVDEAVSIAEKKLLSKKPEQPADTATEKLKQEFQKLTQEHELKMKQHGELKQKVSEAKNISKEKLIEAAREPLMAKLDKERGHTMSDHSIFNAHARHFEDSYFEDMDSLGVLRPDVVTRISDFMDNRVQRFIDKLVEKEFCYESRGSVYFNIDKFTEMGYNYRKLDPVVGDTTAAEMAEGEGALADETAEKKNPNDFAVWKASKPGEPAWDSKWGPGRPGWHIECSVMATEIQGEYLDIHSGGEDLKFPHHDNEMAQTEAYLGRPQWTNYWWHAGHLSMEGLKMSKSLKNFVTIRQALQTHSPRQMRLMFLMQQWDKSMNYSDQAMAMAREEERKFKHVLGSLKFYLRGQHGLSGDAAQDAELLSKVKAAEDTIGVALRDNFCTSKVIDTLSKLATDCYPFYDRVPNANLEAVKKAVALVERILKILGVVDLVPVPEKEAKLTSALDAFANLRQTVRAPVKEKAPIDKVREIVSAALKEAEPAAAAAKQAGLIDCSDKFCAFMADLKDLISSGKEASEILKRCDEVRDRDFVSLDVRLEDKATGFIWMFDSRQAMEREAQEADEKRKEKAKEKIQNKLDLKKKEMSAAEKKAVEPQNLYRTGNIAGTYGTFDEIGAPLTLANGEEVSAKKKKDFIKAIEKQKKDYEAFVKQAGAGGVEAALNKLKEEIQELERQLE